MQILQNNKLLKYSDENYRHSVNYSYKYNFPITLNYGAKHARKKYIISAGSSDNITLLQDGIFIYVIAENSGLNYIGLEVINTETCEVENSVFLDDSELSNNENMCYNLTNLDIQEQIKVLFNYL